MMNVSPYRVNRYTRSPRGVRVPVRAAPVAPKSEPDEVHVAATTESAKESLNEAAEWKERYARLYAELENHKKRLDRRYAIQAGQEKERLLLNMLPLADNLERALLHSDGSEADERLQEGVRITLKAFREVLTKYGVRPFEALGQPFDPELHEAAGVVPDPNFPPGAVVSEEQKGYLLGEKLLRPARVLVAPE